MTPDALRAATGCTPEAAATYAPLLAELGAQYRINTPARLAAFLAQVGHESGGFRHVREIASGSAYEGRRALGNTEPGDGTRYRGRGLIQVTGRFNYAACAAALAPMGAPDFEATPEELERPRWAMLSAGWYWDSRNLNVLADAGDFERITKRINGGLNGQADRLQRWERAKTAMALPTSAPTAQPTKEPDMPLPAILGALLPTLIEQIPKLGKIFGSGSEVAERNVKAAEIAMAIAQEAVGAVNAQDTVDKIKADPELAQAATKAIEARWLELSEAGGDGIAGARKADAEAMAAGPWYSVIKSPSFIVAMLLLPLVYLVVLSLIGVVGTATWSDDVRAGLAGSLISAVIGGLVGYYYGQTTSRNRAP